MKPTGRLLFAIAVLASAVVTAVLPQLAWAEGSGRDPMNSPLWSMLAAKYLPGGPIVFDPAVTVTVPSVVENQAQVPVSVDARALKDVVKVVVITDLNPIQHVLTLSTTRVEPFIAFRLKVEQGTPVRAAAQTSDGVWHVGSVFLDAAGGGCSAPAVGRQKPDWVATLGHTKGRVWREADGTSRLRIRINHPMDTGLAKDNTPAFYIEQVDIKDQRGGELGRLEMFEPVAEDPTLTLMMKLPAADTEVVVDGRDNNGTTFRAKVPANWRSSGLPSAAEPRG
jgi:sulfur-oxidizing protein SoxY